MKKINILEVNNVDLHGKKFNGYDLIESHNDKDFSVKQAVIVKKSNNDKTVKILDNPSKIIINDKFESIEKEESIKNVLSISSPALRSMKEYQEADIIHFHMFHNTNLSLYSLIKISQEKKVIITLHDPWFATGRCVHFYDCDKWKNGCHKCENLSTFFPFKKDNCKNMWDLKKRVFEKLDINLVVATPWMYKIVKDSPILQKQSVDLIPFGIDYKKYETITKEEARKHYHISEDATVLFLRAQNEFKGAPYILEALKEMNLSEKIVVLTCDQKDLFKEVNRKYKVIDLGMIDESEMIYAMNACDMFLMPSIGESFGMMAVEAMACKKTVVVFNNSALQRLLNADT